MFTRVLPAALAAAALMMGSAPVLAQTQPGTTSNGNETTIRGESVLPGRLNPGRQEQPRRNQRPARPAAAPTPEQIKAAAEGLIAATSTTCQATETTLRGQVGEGQSVYEVSCATGPGYVLISSTPPQAVDCVLLSGQADIARARDPEADVGLQCLIEANKNVVKVVAAYAAEAGVKCTVDQGASVGKSSDGNVIYEAGCAGVDGAWIEKTPTGWTKTDCLKVVSSNGVCRYTTPAEQAATLKAWFANSEAAPCDVTEARFMGSNANGSFYEAKCAAGEGLIARFDAAMAVQQVYPCAQAATIGGGCKIGTTPAAAPAPAAPPAPAAASTPQTN